MEWSGALHIAQVDLKLETLSESSVKICNFPEDCYKSVNYLDTINDTMVGYFLTVTECQLMCQGSPTCHHFSYQLTDGQCYLADSPLGNYLPSSGYLSGPQYCTGWSALLLILMLRTSKGQGSWAPGYNHRCPAAQVGFSQSQSQYMGWWLSWNGRMTR